MTSGDFFERIDSLDRQVGHGDLEARVVVDQVYAGYQEFREDLEHPRGGRAHALRDSLFEGNNKRMEEIAARTITPDGSELENAFKDAAEGISSDYFELAPRLVGDLESSGHPIVTSDGATIYDRPPHTPRLSESELRAKARTVREFQDLFGPGVEK